MNAEESYYNGMCRIVCKPTTVQDVGNTVTITNGKQSYSKRIEGVDGAEFLIPGSYPKTKDTLYRINMFKGSEIVYSTQIYAGYGDYIVVYLSEKYAPVLWKDVANYDEMFAPSISKPDLPDKVASANSVINVVHEMRQTFQDGVDRMYNACVIKGSTPESHAVDHVEEAILRIGGGGANARKVGTTTAEYDTVFDCKSLSGWQNFTADNFFLKPKRIAVWWHGTTQGWETHIGNVNESPIQYDASTGTLRVFNGTFGEENQSDEKIFIIADVYVI